MPEVCELKVDELEGAALDWAVAHATEAWTWAHEWFPTMTLDPTFRGVSDNAPNGQVRLVPNNPMRQGSQAFSPSSDWSQGGPLIQKYNVLLTPPTDLVHRNFGSFDKRNGWYESGQWGSTIFGKERKHRRASFHHPNSPLIVAMRAIVQFELGDTVQVPAELAQQLSPA